MTGCAGGSDFVDETTANGLKGRVRVRGRKCGKERLVDDGELIAHRGYVGGREFICRQTVLGG